MSIEHALTVLEQELGARLLSVRRKTSRRVDVEVAAGDIEAISRLLFEALGARFQICSGVDTPDAIELLYHWAFDRLNCVVTVRTEIDRDKPEIGSIAGICPAAEWIERELWELLGVQIQNHPDLRHLLLSDDWPEGKYPLRRDYQR